MYFLPRSVACGKGRPPTSLRPKVLNRPGFISICRLLIRLFWPLSTTKNRNGRSSFKKVFLLDFANCYYSSYLFQHSENDKNIKNITFNTYIPISWNKTCFSFPNISEHVSFSKDIFPNSHLQMFRFPQFLILLIHHVWHLSDGLDAVPIYISKPLPYL